MQIRLLVSPNSKRGLEQCSPVSKCGICMRRLSWLKRLISALAQTLFSYLFALLSWDCALFLIVPEFLERRKVAIGIFPRQFYFCVSSVRAG